MQQGSLAVTMPTAAPGPIIPSTTLPAHSHGAPALAERSPLEFKRLLHVTDIQGTPCSWRSVRIVTALDKYHSKAV